MLNDFSNLLSNLIFILGGPLKKLFTTLHIEHNTYKFFDKKLQRTFKGSKEKYDSPYCSEGHFPVQ